MYANEFFKIYKGLEAARILSNKGARKGGIARANVLTADQRKEIARKAIATRWGKQGKNITFREEEKKEEMPYSMFQGELIVGEIKLPCHVLNSGMRVLTQTRVVESLGMSRGGTSGGGDRLTNFIEGKSIKPFTEAKISLAITAPIIFSLPNGGKAYGYEATLLPDIFSHIKGI